MTAPGEIGPKENPINTKSTPKITLTPEQQVLFGRRTGETVTSLMVLAPGRLAR
jgi:hypothetical protein